MIGVSFQPGSDQFGQQNGNGAPLNGSGVQEAIKILSLRLPRVLGAQPAASMPLLTSQGSGGNPRIDAIVNQIMSRVMPGQQGPSFGGPPQMPWQPQQPQMDWFGSLQRAPRVSVGEGPQQPVRQPPSIDNAPYPYPFERGPERQPPSIDYVPERQSPSIDYAPHPAWPTTPFPEPSPFEPMF